MLFTTDQQTLDDLNIFGKHSANSVYAIFNHTFTRGGAALLEEMFRFPLGNAAAINKRSGIIQYFAGIPAFPFNNELFDIAEQYLSNLDERTKVSAEGDKIANRLSSLLLDDTNYKFVHQGVHAIIDIFKRLLQFIDKQESANQGAYADDQQAILTLLHNEALVSLLNEDNQSNLSYAQLAAYDQLIRFRQRDKIKRLLRYIYELDVYICVARVAAGRGFIFPGAVVKGTSKLVLEGIYHPEMENGIANDLNLGKDNIVFLTGANMAGKSTLMKSLGIAMYLAHMGFPVAASKMEFSVLDGIYTTINLPDNIGMGTSHFYAEVLRIKKIAKELSLSKNLFVIIDELFRGTNVKDAGEATIAITEAFAERQDSIFVISTHIIEAGEVLRQSCKPISFMYLPTLMDGNRPVYTYKLKKGITKDRHGMIIINNEGILAMLDAGIEKMNKIIDL